VNHVAVAAAALAARGARVAVLDFDVHHGNGTQDIFYADGRVFFASSHEYPFYPGTGAVVERGVGDGAGATVNVPLPHEAGDHALVGAYTRVILPAMARFAPDVVLVSAGFDAHKDDPLASLRVTEAGYAQLVRHILDAAARTGARVAMTLEGGYGLAGLGRSVVATVEALLGRPIAPEHARLAGTLREEDRRALEAAERSVELLPPPSPPRTAARP
jgi:acetoin utilization deacetylase AcuC-like enzyme